MPKLSPTEYIVYAVILLLSLAILVLVVISPPKFMDTKSVYQGF